MRIFWGLVLAICLTLPSFGTDYTYHANNYHNNHVVNVIQKKVQFDDRYYLGLDGYYAIGQSLGNRYENTVSGRQNEAINGLNQNITVLGQKIDNLGTKVDNLQTSINGSPTPNPTPSPSPTPRPPQPTPDPTPPTP